MGLVILRGNQIFFRPPCHSVMLSFSLSLSVGRSAMITTVKSLGPDFNSSLPCLPDLLPIPPYHHVRTNLLTDLGKYYLRIQSIASIPHADKLHPHRASHTLSLPRLEIVPPDCFLISRPISNAGFLTPWASRAPSSSSSSS